MSDGTLKFCKDCIHSILSYTSGFTQYECHHEKNLCEYPSLVDGQRQTFNTPGFIRTDPEQCGTDAKWFERKALPQGYQALGYIPVDASPVQAGETMEERLTRLRNTAKKAITSRSLKNITVDDL